MKSTNAATTPIYGQVSTVGVPTASTPKSAKAAYPTDWARSFTMNVRLPAVQYHIIHADARRSARKDGTPKTYSVVRSDTGTKQATSPLASSGEMMPLTRGLRESARTAESSFLSQSSLSAAPLMCARVDMTAIQTRSVIDGPRVAVRLPRIATAAVTGAPCTRPTSMNARNFSNAIFAPDALFWTAKTIFIEVYM